VKIREETVQLVHETVCIPVGKIAKKAVWSAFLLIQHSKYSAMLWYTLTDCFFGDSTHCVLYYFVNHPIVI